MPLRFMPMPARDAAALRRGEPDANGQPPEVFVAHESGAPCRHCLRPIMSGERYLLAGYRPFPAPQPYAEIGPIFLHAEACPGYEDADGLPPILEAEGHVIIRGYGDDDRIVYGSGQVTAIGTIRDEAGTFLMTNGSPISTSARRTTTATSAGSTAPDDRRDQKAPTMAPITTDTASQWPPSISMSMGLRAA